MLSSVMFCIVISANAVFSWGTGIAFERHVATLYREGEAVIKTLE
jgi:hypothetical protein